MRAAVFTGGGADGGVTIGRLSKTNTAYNFAVTISTGSLLGPLALLRKWDRLIEYYSSVETPDITEKSAFTSKGRLHIGKAFYRSLLSLVSKQNEIGQSKNLRKLIDELFTLEDYKAIKLSNRKVYVGAYSLTYEENEYFSSEHEKFEDFKDWMWASANAPVVFPTLKKARKEGGEIEEWVDGGVKRNNPLAIAIAKGAKEVDVYMHSPRPVRKKKKFVTNTFHFILRLAKALFKHSTEKDLTEGLALAKAAKAVVRVHWMDKEYYSNSLVFGKEKMAHLVKVGQDLATNPDYIDIYDYRT